MIRVTRRYRFSSSHRLYSSQLSEEENRALYGKCSNPFGHGHNYLLEVSARGEVVPRTGRAVDSEALDRLVEEQVISRYDHRNLNEDVQEFRQVVPTTENLAVEIARRLKGQWTAVFPQGGPVLEKVRIQETKRNIFEVAEKA